MSSTVLFRMARRFLNETVKLAMVSLLVSLRNILLQCLWFSTQEPRIFYLSSMSALTTPDLEERQKQQAELEAQRTPSVGNSGSSMLPSKPAPPQDRPGITSSSTSSSSGTSSSLSSSSLSGGSSHHPPPPPRIPEGVLPCSSCCYTSPPSKPSGSSSPAPLQPAFSSTGELVRWPSQR